MGYELELYVVEDNNRSTSSFSEYGSNLVFSYKEGEHYICHPGGENTIMVCGEPVCELNYASIIGMVDLCNPGGESNIRELQNSCKEATCYIFNDDRNTAKTIDRYGKRLKQASLEEVIEALEKDCEEEYYRRYKSALGLLKACTEDYINPQVLFYGY